MEFHVLIKAEFLYIDSGIRLKKQDFDLLKIGK